MKKFLLVSLSILISQLVKATVFTVDVINNQFNPDNLNVMVGDIVRFNFVSGFHNAVSTGAPIPAGAAQINSGGILGTARTYDYSVAVVGTYHYYCEAHGSAAGTGMAGQFIASGPLPVTLRDFNVSTTTGNKPLISWTTATEQNVSHFSVRSSVDGKHFTEVGKVNAKGNSSAEQKYSFIDKNISNQYRFLFYELLIVDRDGQVAYSPIKSYKTGFAFDKLIIQMGPNPITRPGQLMLQFNAEKEGKVQVNVFDASGRKTLKTILAAMPGLNNGHIHVCDFSPGVYTLQFAYEGMVESRKLVVK